MAMSKALQTKTWWEEVGAWEKLAHMEQPSWLDRARRQAKGKKEKVADERWTLNNLPSLVLHETTINFTLHAKHRMARRNLSVEEIGYVLLYGQRWHKAGAVIMHLRRKDIPLNDQVNGKWVKLIGATVVLATAGDDTVLTAYRNRQAGLHRIKCKPDHGWN